MSVIVKGMKMPACCGDCEMIKIRQTSMGLIGNCPFIGTVISFDTKEEITKRNSRCPLIEVPSHGRLIDADILTNFQMSGKVSSADGSDWGRQTWVVLPHYSSLSEIPTVLEADYE